MRTVDGRVVEPLERKFDRFGIDRVTVVEGGILAQGDLPGEVIDFFPLFRQGWFYRGVFLGAEQGVVQIVADTHGRLDGTTHQIQSHRFGFLDNHQRARLARRGRCGKTHGHQVQSQQKQHPSLHSQPPSLKLVDITDPPGNRCRASPCTHRPPLSQPGHFIFTLLITGPDNDAPLALRSLFPLTPHALPFTNTGGMPPNGLWPPPGCQEQPDHTLPTASDSEGGNGSRTGDRWEMERPL